MGLKFQIDKLEDVPEAVRAYYVQDTASGKFRLDADGVVPKERLDEFRNNNIELQKQIDKFKNVDPEKHRELLNLQRQLEEGELIKKGDIEGLVNLRITRMKEENETKITELTTSNQQMSSKLSVLLIDNVVKSAAIQSGVVPTAVDDVILRARGIYFVENGEVVPKGPDGKIVYGTDGQKPLTVVDWLKDLKKTAPHLFQGSQGGGAGGGNRTGGTPNMSDLSAVQRISLGLSQMKTPKDAGLP